MKVHTNNRAKVIEILNSIKVGDNKFIDTYLTWKEVKNYAKPEPLDDSEWIGMPEFEWSKWMDERAVFDIKLNNEKEREVFFKAFDRKPTILNYIHYEMDEHPLKDTEYEFSEPISPKYPIYVITKGRWEKTLTIDTLESMNVDFRICVEPSEYDNYSANPNIDSNKLIKLPENFSERKQGGIPVRNFVWQHSIDRGFDKHWIIDDNIKGFFRWNQNVQKEVKDGVFFRIMEDFSDRYENVGLTSCQYASFVPSIDRGRSAYIRNTRTYSCILINTKLLDVRLEERWRGRYNEDTDLTLRVLSTGDLCTINFNSLLSGKQTTGSMKGGNTDTIYELGKDNTNDKWSGLQKKFDELKENWGDIVTFTNNRHKDGRPHHHIAYTKLFTQPLKLKEGIDIKPGVNNYNMTLVNKTNK